MEEKLELFKCLLDHDFYEENKHRLTEELFPRELHSLYNTVIDAHTKYDRSLKLAEVWELYKSTHPTLTTAKKEEAYKVISNVKECESLSKDISEDIIRNAWKDFCAEELANIALEIAEGKHENFNGIQDILDRMRGGYVEDDEIEYTSTDIGELLKVIEHEFRWKFNLAPMQEVLGGFGPGLFGIIAARPDAGKTATWISLCFGPGGWLAQGANVHIIANEEPAIRIMARGVSACTGMPLEEIKINKGKAQEEFNKIRSKVFLRDTVDMTIETLDLYCAEHDVDILIIDQLDKLGIKGKYNRSDEQLKALYTQAREISKRRECGVIGLTQAGMDAHGKLYYGFEALDGSKTGKAAEADFVLCIGMTDPAENEGGRDNYQRTANFPKNKLTGCKDNFGYILNNHLSRMEP